MHAKSWTDEDIIPAEYSPPDQLSGVTLDLIRHAWLAHLEARLQLTPEEAIHQYGSALLSLTELQFVSAEKLGGKLCLRLSCTVKPEKAVGLEDVTISLTLNASTRGH